MLKASPGKLQRLGVPIQIGARRVEAILFIVVFGLLPGVPASAETISLWHAMNGKAGEAMEEQCGRFNASYASHRIRCKYQGDYARLMQKTIAAFRAGQQPTLVQFFDVATRDILQSNAVLRVGSLYARDGDLSWEADLLPAVRAWYADSNGNLVGQPYNVSTALLYANDSQLLAAGVSSPPSTWEDLRDAAKKLKASGSRCPFVTDLDAWTVLEQFAAVQGMAIADPRNGHDGLTARYNVTSPLLQRHLQFLFEGKQEGWLRLNSQTKAGDASSAFRSGECGMLLASTGVWASIQSTVGRRQKVSANPIPVNRGSVRHRSSIGGGALYLMKGASRAQESAALAFLAFVRQPKEQLRFSQQTGFLPFTHEAVQVRRAAQPASTIGQDAVESGLDSLTIPAASIAPGIRLGFYAQFRAAWKEELQRAFASEQTIAQAMERARIRGDELLRRFAMTYAESESP